MAATRYGITASVTHHDTYSRTFQLPYFELNANVQGILDEAGARNVALGILADTLDIMRADLSDPESKITADVTAVKLDD